MSATSSNKAIRVENQKRLKTVGDASVLDDPMVALFCSVKCPGKLILDTYDLAKHFRSEGITVISGFHSPMEQECLRILIRSPHQTVWCLARGIYRQIPKTPVDCRTAVAEDRLVMVTSFPDTMTYITKETAIQRNRLVAELASAIVVAHAAPGSKTENFCHELLSMGKPLYTFDHPDNKGLIAAGARTLEFVADWNIELTRLRRVESLSNLL
jgi:predicted Rossmann fold nucleotide-binding protein DprA/Smf involved in DNA uptake